MSSHKARRTHRPEDRDIALYLTRRQAEMVMGAIRNAVKKAAKAKAKEPDFVPEPGKGDANMAKIDCLSQVYEELNDRYRAVCGIGIPPGVEDRFALKLPEAAT